MITQQTRFREDIKHWALRSLGAPALQINVAPEQIEDRIDEALHFYWRWHFDGHYRDYIMHEITQEELSTKNIVIDPWVYTITRILRLGGLGTSFNLEYQSFMQNIGQQVIVRGTGLVNFTVAQSYISLIDDFWRREKILDFNFSRGVLHIRSDMSQFQPGDIIAIECWRFCDPEEYPRVWNELWLKKYTAALIKKQWGQNMLKYDGFQLPSGITLNGRSIYEDANNEILKLEEDLQSKETLPPDFFVG